MDINPDETNLYGFNTASGKHCCNPEMIGYVQNIIMRFNTASGKHCCNFEDLARVYEKLQFQYRKR